MVTGYKTNIQKSIAFQYTNNEAAEREMKKTIPFTIAPKNNKIEINLIRELNTNERNSGGCKEMESHSMLVGWKNKYC